MCKRVNFETDYESLINLNIFFFSESRHITMIFKISVFLLFTHFLKIYIGIIKIFHSFRPRNLFYGGLITQTTLNKCLSAVVTGILKNVKLIKQAALSSNVLFINRALIHTTGLENKNMQTFNPNWNYL